MSKPAYRVVIDKSVGCNCGHWGQNWLTALETWLPSFYLCPACGDVAQSGVGRVGKIKLAKKPSPRPGGR